MKEKIKIISIEVLENIIKGAVYNETGEMDNYLELENGGKVFPNIMEILNELYSKINLENQNLIVKIIIGISKTFQNQKLISQLESQIDDRYSIKVVIVSNWLLSLYSVTNISNNGIVIDSSVDCLIVGKKETEIRKGLDYDSLLFNVASSYSLVHERIIELIKRYEKGKSLSNNDQEIIKLFKVNTVEQLQEKYVKMKKTKYYRYQSYFHMIVIV